VRDELVNISLELNIDHAALNSTVGENKFAVLLHEQVTLKSELVLSALTLAAELPNSLVVVDALLLSPGHAVGLAGNPIIRIRIHLGATVVLLANTLEHQVMVACTVVRTPDDGPHVGFEKTRKTRELTIPTPEVIVVVVEGILRSGNFDTTRKNVSQCG